MLIERSSQVFPPTSLEKHWFDLSLLFLAKLHVSTSNVGRPSRSFPSTNKPNFSLEISANLPTVGQAVQAGLFSRIKDSAYFASSKARQWGTGDKIELNLLFSHVVWILLLSNRSDACVQITSWVTGEAPQQGVIPPQSQSFLCFCNLRFSLAVKTWAVSNIHAKVFTPVKENQCSLQPSVKNQGFQNRGCVEVESAFSHNSSCPHTSKEYRDVRCYIHSCRQLSVAWFLYLLILSSRSMNHAPI